MRRALSAVAAVVAIIAAGCAQAPPIAEGTGNVAEAAEIEPDGPPSIVLILSDDQRWDTMWAMPRVEALLARHGVTFINGFVVNPVCCPSRTSILTGSYSHSTKVYTNQVNEPFGGFDAFRDRATIATALQTIGYRTALVGKYLNGYQGKYVPPGWDRWFATYDRGGYYDYRATSDGELLSFGSDRGSYGTDVLADEAAAFIFETDPSQPLFLYFAPHAPHEPATPAPRDENALAGLPRWRPHSYAESDVRDKPLYLRSRSLGPDERARIDEFRRDQYRSLLAVDRAVAQIVSALRVTDRLGNTMIVYASDNGMLWGEHRWASKNVPYEESIHVPMIVRYDPVTAASPRNDDSLVLNIDLAPTFAQLAGAELPGMEGQNLLPLMEDRGTEWRTDFLIEHLNLGGTGPPTFCAVRTADFKFVRYGTGEVELYDLRSDPFELRNRATRAKFAGVLKALERRLVELCHPAPPGYEI